MSRRPAVCGTDAGYYRHRRGAKTDPCAACKAAHSLATKRTKGTRSKGLAEKKTCGCGRSMLSTSEACYVCNRTLRLARKSRAYYDPDDDPKRPVAWRRKGLIQVPVYEQSEVA